MQHCTMNGHDIGYDDGIDCPACEILFRIAELAKERDDMAVECRDMQARLNRVVEGSTDADDWARWAREVCADFREPFDEHTAGLRLAIVRIIHQAERRGYSTVR